MSWSTPTSERRHRSAIPVRSSASELRCDTGVYCVASHETILRWRENILQTCYRALRTNVTPRLRTLVKHHAATITCMRPAPAAAASAAMSNPASQCLAHPEQGVSAAAAREQRWKQCFRQMTTALTSFSFLHLPCRRHGRSSARRQRLRGLRDANAEGSNDDDAAAAPAAILLSSSGRFMSAVSRCCGVNSERHAREALARGVTWYLRGRTT